MREITIFSGTAHPELALEVCECLGVPLSPITIRHFSNDCLYVQLNANCREADVFLIQPLVPPVQEHLVELLLMPDAARGASAARVTAVIPHYAYGRSDKKDKPRISLAGRLVADLLVTAGTLVELLHRLRERRVGRIAIACTHGLFTGPAIERLRSQPDVAEIVTTNTVPIPEEKRLPHMTVLSIAPLLAEAIRRIHHGKSVSELFATHWV